MEGVPPLMTASVVLLGVAQPSAGIDDDGDVCLSELALKIVSKLPGSPGRIAQLGKFAGQTTEIMAGRIAVSFPSGQFSAHR